MQNTFSPTNLPRETHQRTTNWQRVFHAHLESQTVITCCCCFQIRILILFRRTACKSFSLYLSLLPPWLTIILLWISACVCSSICLLLIVKGAPKRLQNCNTKRFNTHKGDAAALAASSLHENERFEFDRGWLCWQS